MMLRILVMKIQMYTSSNSIKLCLIGKPNSGKSTLFNTLIDSNISPVGDEYGLTKILYQNKFKFKNYEFNIIDTPGLRRKSKIYQKDEQKRNLEVIKLISSVDVLILLIDAVENITKQDFRLADHCINKNKIIFFLFNKIDVINEKIEFKNKIKKYLKNNYSKSKMINIDFISAKKNIRITNVLLEITKKRELMSTIIKKVKLKKFILYLAKQAKYPRVKNIEIKPKYIVQLTNKVPTFKVFINSNKKAPQIFQKFFENAFRKFFKLEGIPIILKYESSKNPYIH